MLKIVGEIPARLGSKRVPQKNLRLLNGRELIRYSIDAAKDSRMLSDIYVNSESDILGRIAVEMGVKFYKRPQALARDEVTSDIFNYYFIKAVGADILVMVNPVSPLIDGKDIDEIVRFFLDNDYDTILPVREEYLQAFYNGEAINFNPKGILPRTQDIPPVQLCIWSVCVWRAQTFVRCFEENNYATFSGRVGFYPISHLKAVKISTEEDFMLAEALLVKVGK